MMRFFRAIGRLIFNRLVLQMLGLLLLALLIWFVGPLIAFAGRAPLEREETRWWTIGILVGLFLLRELVRWWRRRGINARLMGFLAPAVTPGAEAETLQGAQEVAELRQRFADALGTLRKARLKPATGHWWTRIGRQYVYELPWYMFIGAPGSGKTTALTNAGLTFPLEEKFGKTAIRGVGGTRNCDWWFTNEAVMLDTAGRYTTQESNEALDKHEWEGFLGLLKRFRPRQPLNGVLLTLAVPDILAMSDEERRNHAAVLRKRLYELRDQLAIQFPVYLLVTKCDLIGGFGEYFGRLNREQRAQVWGFTFPYQASPDGKEEESGPGFGREFGLLSQRLYEQLNATLLSEPDLERSALAYTFPQNFDGLKDVLAQFVGEVFVRSKYGEPPLLRGVYFSSGAQEGAPFDRVLGVLTKAFRISTGSRPPALTQGRGTSFFLSDLLLKVVFQEVGLAGRNITWERRRALLRTAGAVACGVALVVAGIAWTISYRHNTQYLQDVDESSVKASQALQTFGRTPESSLDDLMSVLTQVRAVPTTPEFAVEDPPLPLTYGLYQGRKMESVAQLAYGRALEDGLLPHISRRIESWLRNPPQANNLELLYETLKAYLMLYDPAHFDAAFMESFSLSVLAQELQMPVTNEQRDLLASHVSALFRGGRVLSSPYPLDNALVQQVRDRLSTFSVAQLSYLRLKRRLSQNGLGEFTVLKAAGPSASSVLRFRSGKPLSNGVPGLFTYRGWHELFKKEVDSVATRFGIDEAWVLEDASKSARQRADEIAQGKLATEVKRLYLNEYADTWDAFLRDLQLVTPTNLERSMQTARILSAPDSPLSLLLKAASVETTLLREEKTDNRSLLGRTLQQARNNKDDLERIIGTNVLPAGQQPRERLELIVDNRFAPLRALAGTGTSGTALIDTTVLPLINELYLSLAATDSAVRAGIAPPQNDVPTKMRAEASRFPMPVREMLTSLASAGANQAASMVRANVNSQIDASVGQFCRKAVAGRYPVVRGATQEITPGDFAQLFAPGALMDDFFQKNLSSMVDTTTNPWSFRRSVDGASAGGSASLPPFQQAQTIRDVFFRSGGRTPQLSITMKPIEMDPAILQLVIDIDGQLLRYAHGPLVAQTITWPGPRGSNQVRVQATPAAAGAASLATEGPWALHRFFDKLQITPGNSPERFTATLTLDGRKATFEIIAASVQNPFALAALQNFHCPGR